MKATLLMAACVVLTLFVATSHAALIAWDSFATSAGGNDYPVGSIQYQNPTVGASGFKGAWNGGTRHPVALNGGYTHDLTPGDTYDGELVSFGSQGSVGGSNARNLSREIDYTPTDGTYYMSVLLRKNAATDRADLLVGLGRSQSPTTGVLSVDGTWIGFLDGGIEFGWGPGANLTPLLSSTQMNVGETYFALLEYDYSTSGSDTVTATIFDGSSEEVASQEFPGLDLDSTMGRFSVLTQDFGPIPIVDEWRFGTELSDVMVLNDPNGDFDMDGDVDGADFLMWQRGFGAAGSHTEGDANNDGTVNAADLTIWESQYGTGDGTGAVAVAVPEPNSLALYGLVLLGWLFVQSRTGTRYWKS